MQWISRFAQVGRLCLFVSSVRLIMQRWTGDEAATRGKAMAPLSSSPLEEPRHLRSRHAVQSRFI
jgi:hypothetical protein